MGLINSNEGFASDAITQLVNVDTSQTENKQVEFDDSHGISGMENGRLVTNQMLNSISQFSAAVLVQAEKIPEIANKLEKRDFEESKRWRSSYDN